MRKEISRIRKEEKTATLEALYKAAGRIEGDDAVTSFIDVILTESERITVGRRLLIANMILNGQAQYEINNKLGVSPNTFSRINYWLSGEFPDYDQVLKNTTFRIEDKKATLKRIRPFTFEYLQDKYPMHYLLFTLSKKTLRNLKD